MVTPLSLTYSPFTTLGKFNDRLLEDDFCFDVFGTLKLKSVSLKGALINYKAKVNLKQDQNKEVVARMGDELKLQFPFGDRYTFWGGVRRNGDLKLHIDGGRVNFGQDFNIFGNVKTNLDFNKAALRLGASYFGPTFESNTRLEIGPRTNQLGLTQRLLLKQGKLFYGFTGTLSFNTFNLTRYDGVIGYEDRDLDVYVRHLSAQNRAAVPTPVHGAKHESTTLPPASHAAHSNPLGLTVLNVNYRLKNRTTAALQFEHDFQRNDFSVVVGGEHYLSDRVTAKVRTDNQFNVALASKMRVNNLLTLTVSGLLALGKGADAFNFNHVLPIPLGFTAELSV